MKTLSNAVIINGVSYQINATEAKKVAELLGITPNTNTTNTTTVEYNTYSPQFNLEISGVSDERTLKRKIKQWISESMEETFESIGRTNNAELQEV